jgi:DNA replication protein DnaC
MLFDVLNARYNELRPTILIGNLTARSWRRYLGERIMERLMDLGSAWSPSPGRATAGAAESV